MRSMTGDEYNKWQHLLHHIVDKYFGWAYRRQSGSKAMFRLLDRNDLIQEGAIGLLEAWTNYEPDKGKATFKTFAFYHVYWKVFHFIYGNITTLSMKGWDKDEDKERVSKALSCYLFSEIQLGESQDLSELADEGKDGVSLEDKELIEKLKERMRDGGVDLLLKRFSGQTYAKLGEHLECSGEWARLLVLSLLRDAEEFAREEGDGA